MPKKTLREKLLAQKHREKLLTNFNLSKTYNHSIGLSLPAESSEITIPSPNRALPKLNASSHQSNIANYSYVVNDLKRIFVISLLAFAFEGMLYFFLVKQFHIF